MLAKLVGGLHKPNQQAILNAVNHEQIQTFLDTFSLRKLNGFGRVIVEKIRKLIELSEDDQLTVKITRQKFSQKHLIKEFGLKLGQKLWNLLHGIDEETVKQSPDCPKQISVEDSNHNIASLFDAENMLNKITPLLIKRLDEEFIELDDSNRKNFKLYPTKVRLSFRRLSNIPNTRTSNALDSASANFDISVLKIDKFTIEQRSKLLVKNCLYALLVRLWYAGIRASKLRVINVAFTDFSSTTLTSKSIEEYFTDRKIKQKSNEVIVIDDDCSDEYVSESEDNDKNDPIICPICNLELMSFTVEAHLRFHESID